MKKIIIFLVVVLIIVAIISYMYLNYKFKYSETKRENIQYESYYQQEIYGADLATLINKATDDNVKNKVEKDNQGRYIDNKENSIKVDIKFIDDDSIHTMEEIYNSGISIFVQYYNQIKFKCMEIEYHEKTGKVRYLYFEQITS